MRNSSEPPPSVYYGPDIPPPPDLTTSLSPNGGVVVRAEEALIVILVLVLWVGAIALFFNRWGKIRMLEPYQPKFHQEHRPSCPMATTDTNQARASISKYNLMEGGYLLRNPSTSRPRQNSVFIGGSPAYNINPPRKTKSAADLQSLVGPEPPARPLPLTAARRPSSVGYLSPRRPSCFCPEDRRPSFSNVLTQVTAERRPSFTNVLAQVTAERRPSFSNVLAQVTAERRPSSSLLRISNV